MRRILEEYNIQGGKKREKEEKVRRAEAAAEGRLLSGAQDWKSQPIGLTTQSMATPSRPASLGARNPNLKSAPGLLD